MQKNGKRYSCTTENIEFSKEECDKCSEFRTFENGLCVFSRSPYPQRPLMSITNVIESWGPRGSSYKAVYFESCNFLSSITTSPENCAQCSNREYVNGNCVLKTCPRFYFTGHRGRCFSCLATGISESIDNYQTTKEECGRCPEREYKDGLCVLRECPQDSPVKSKEGGCYPCNFPLGELKIEEGECLKCPQREYKEGQCVEKCKKNEFRTSWGRCYSCDYKGRVFDDGVSLEECKKCPNRTWEKFIWLKSESVQELGECGLK